MHEQQHRSEDVDKCMPLAVDAATVAKMLHVSLRHLRRMDASGKLGPHGLRFGRSVRYSVEEVRRWLEAGAPDRATWDQIKGN